MRRTYCTLNDGQMQHNAEIGIFTKPSVDVLGAKGPDLAMPGADEFYDRVLLNFFKGSLLVI